MEVRTPLDTLLWSRGISGRAFAQTLGIHEAQVSRWRKGLHVPEVERQEQIAALLECDVSELWPEAKEAAA